MKETWYRTLSRLLTKLYYHRVRVINPQSLPASGPVLFVALHRNGAVDGYVYKSVIPRANFLISVQLRRSLMGRLFFSGVEVARGKDRAKAGAVRDGDDREALDACSEYVSGGGALIIMPEGSSDLGYRHLPFHKGAARILAQLVSNPPQSLQVVPLGIHYEQAWAWQSDVEVVVGKAISTDMPADMTTSMRIEILNERIVRALETLAVQAESAELFAARERIAYAATLGSERSYFSALKALEGGMPEATALDDTLTATFASTPLARRLWKHQGVPLMPMRGAWLYPLLWLVLLPSVLLACLLNIFPLLCARWAGERFSDGKNTIALWRLLVGFPCLSLWAATLLVIALFWHLLPLWFGYAFISVLGLRSVRHFRKLSVSLHNWMVAAPLRQPLLHWREALESCMRAIDV